MQFTDFTEANTKRTAPEGMEDTVGTLPVYFDGVQTISCWVPTQAEREAIAAGLPVWLGVLGGQPPVWVSGLKPDMPTMLFEVTPEVVDGLQQFARRLPLPESAGGRPVPGAVLVRKQPELRGPDGQPLDPERLYFVSSAAAQRQHFTAMCEAHSLGGVQAVAAYLQPYAEFLHTPDSQPAQ